MTADRITELEADLAAVGNLSARIEGGMTEFFAEVLACADALMIIADSGCDQEKNLRTVARKLRRLLAEDDDR